MSHRPSRPEQDAAHLPNERIRLVNLLRGVDVIEALLRKAGALPRQQAGWGGATQTAASSISVATTPVGSPVMAAPVDPLMSPAPPKP